MSLSWGKVEKYAWLHNALRTPAMVLKKVTCGLGYQAAQRRQICPVENNSCAASVTMEYKPSRQGVVRAIALSDH